jgi:hypothetical protein
MPKRKTGLGFSRRTKPKEGEDRRYTGAPPGRPRKVKEDVEDVPALNWGELRQTLPALLWGDAAVYEKALEFEATYYETTGQLQRALELSSGAEQSSYRQRGLGGEKQAARDRQRALMQCSVVEHAGNQHRTYEVKSSQARATRARSKCVCDTVCAAYSTRLPSSPATPDKACPRRRRE